MNKPLIIFSASKYSIESNFVSCFVHSLPTTHYSTPPHNKLTYATYVQRKLDYLYTSSKNLHLLSDNSGYKQQTNFDFYAYHLLL